MLAAKATIRRAWSRQGLQWQLCAVASAQVREPASRIKINASWVPGTDPEAGLKRKMAGTKVPAKFEQGGFTSGRRKGPKTLFPSRTRELALAAKATEKLVRSVIACSRYAVWRSRLPRGISSGTSAKSAILCNVLASFENDASASAQLSRLSATLRSRKSRKTLIRFEARSSSG